MPATPACDMETPDEVPVFGQWVLDCPYVIRPSAYALVRNAESSIAVVRTASGCFLPGGGIEGAEDFEHAIQREALEECGLVLSVVRLIGRAVEIVYSEAERTCFEKRSAFAEARVDAAGPAKEPNHELLWLAASEAIAQLSHGSHRWAVRRLETAA